MTTSGDGPARRMGCLMPKSLVSGVEMVAMLDVERRKYRDMEEAKWLLCVRQTANQMPGALLPFTPRADDFRVVIDNGAEDSPICPVVSERSAGQNVATTRKGKSHTPF